MTADTKIPFAVMPIPFADMRVHVADMRIPVADTENLIADGENLSADTTNLNADKDISTADMKILSAGKAILMLTQLELHYRDTPKALGEQGGMLGLTFRKAQRKIKEPAKLRWTPSIFGVRQVVPAMALRDGLRLAGAATSGTAGT
jgi:hypothetical protein